MRMSQSAPEVNESDKSPEDRTERPVPGTPAGRVRLVLSTVLGVIWVSVPGLLGFWLLAEIGSIGDWLIAMPGAEIGEVPVMALVAYIVFFAVTSGFGILPTYAQAILGGWIFGFVLGTPAALLGFTGGALVGWFVCRLVSSDAVTHWIDRNRKWGAVRRAFVSESRWRTFGLVTLIRLPPNSPFAFTNLAMAAGGVGLSPYLLGTIVGMTPRTAIACALAASAAATGSVDIQTFVKDQGWWPLIAGIVILIVAFAILSRIANHTMARVLPDEAA